MCCCSYCCNIFTCKEEKCNLSSSHPKHLAIWSVFKSGSDWINPAGDQWVKTKSVLTGSFQQRELQPREQNGEVPCKTCPNGYCFQLHMCVRELHGKRKSFSYRQRQFSTTVLLIYRTASLRPHRGLDRRVHFSDQPQISSISVLQHLKCDVGAALSLCMCAEIYENLSVHCVCVCTCVCAHVLILDIATGKESLWCVTEQLIISHSAPHTVDGRRDKLKMSRKRKKRRKKERKEWNGKISILTQSKFQWCCMSKVKLCSSLGL